LLRCERMTRHAQEHKWPDKSHQLVSKVMGMEIGVVGAAKSSGKNIGPTQA